MIMTWRSTLTVTFIVLTLSSDQPDTPTVSRRKSIKRTPSSASSARRSEASTDSTHSGDSSRRAVPDQHLHQSLTHPFLNWDQQPISEDVIVLDPCLRSLCHNDLRCQLAFLLISLYLAVQRLLIRVRRSTFFYSQFQPRWSQRVKSLLGVLKSLLPELEEINIKILKLSYAQDTTVLKSFAEQTSKMIYHCYHFIKNAHTDIVQTQQSKDYDSPSEFIKQALTQYLHQDSPYLATLIQLFATLDSLQFTYLFLMATLIDQPRIDRPAFERLSNEAIRKMSQEILSVSSALTALQKQPLQQPSSTPASQPASGAASVQAPSLAHPSKSDILVFSDEILVFLRFIRLMFVKDMTFLNALARPAKPGEPTVVPWPTKTQLPTPIEGTILQIPEFQALKPFDKQCFADPAIFPEPTYNLFFFIDSQQIHMHPTLTDYIEYDLEEGSSAKSSEKYPSVASSILTLQQILIQAFSALLTLLQKLRQPHTLFSTALKSFLETFQELEYGFLTVRSQYETKAILPLSLTLFLKKIKQLRKFLLQLQHFPETFKSFSVLSFRSARLNLLSSFELNSPLLFDLVKEMSQTKHTLQQELVSKYFLMKILSLQTLIELALVLLIPEPLSIFEASFLTIDQKYIKVTKCFNLIGDNANEAYHRMLTLLPIKHQESKPVPASSVKPLSNAEAIALLESTSEVDAGPALPKNLRQSIIETVNNWISQVNLLRDFINRVKSAIMTRKMKSLTAQEFSQYISEFKARLQYTPLKPQEAEGSSKEKDEKSSQSKRSEGSSPLKKSESQKKEKKSGVKLKKKSKSKQQRSTKSKSQWFGQ